MERVQKHSQFLRELIRSRHNKKKRSEKIRQATKGQICTVCEVVKNVIHIPILGIKLGEARRRKLARQRKKIDQLISRQVPEIQKRQILQQQRGGGIILPLILSLAAPFLSRLIGTSK